jgi:hypothetical protein
MSDATREKLLRTVLVIYLLVIGLSGAALVLFNFPQLTPDKRNLIFPRVLDPGWNFLVLGFQSSDQGLLFLAFCAGVAGSFIYAAQSLSSYFGNEQFKASWTVWYLLRPWVGGVLGLAVYFVFRAGLVAGADLVNPYGVAAVAMLGGWFSTITSDKLQEVFETLFVTKQDEKRKDKLHPVPSPVIDDVQPPVVPPGQTEVIVTGRNFLAGAMVRLDATEVKPTSATAAELKVPLGQLAPRPAAGAKVRVQVKNPEGGDSLSNAVTITFE